MASKYAFAPNGKSYYAQLYIVARKIAHEISWRKKDKPRCRHCLNTRKGCDGCAEVEDFFPIIERIVADELEARKAEAEKEARREHSAGGRE